MSASDLDQQIKHHQSVKRLLILLTGAVFLIELVVMIFLSKLPPLPNIVVFLLDSTLLATLIFPVFYFLVFRPLSQNITQLIQAEDNLRISSVAFESKDPILITDADANILKANKMFLKITGYSLEELIGENPRILQTGENSKDHYKKMWTQLLHNGCWTGDTYIKDKRGREFPIGMVITAVKNEQQETTHYVAIYNI